jgi:hypothetical protein
MKNKSMFDSNFNFIDFYLRHDNPTWLNISISFYVLGKKCFNIFNYILKKILFKNINKVLFCLNLIKYSLLVLKIIYDLTKIF